jgi:hypothetical protein
MRGGGVYDAVGLTAIALQPGQSLWSKALDALFRQQLADLLATRLRAVHAGSPTTSLGYASQTAFAAAVDRRNSEQLATARTLTAIALQACQSLWGSGTPGSLDHRCAHDNNRRRQTMVWKSFISQLAITSQRKVLVTAVLYAISVIVHFTSPVSDGTEIPAHSAQRTNPLELRAIHGGHSAGGGNALAFENIKPQE